MINELKSGSNDSRRFLPCPSAVTSGMPCLYGFAACVAVDNYDSNIGGTVFCFEGTFTLTVQANSQASPPYALPINPGDQLYANGTLDTTTGITYNLTIDKSSYNCPFGQYEGVGQIAAGQTSTTAAVRVKTGLAPGPYIP